MPYIQPRLKMHTVSRTVSRFAALWRKFSTFFAAPRVSKNNKHFDTFSSPLTRTRHALVLTVIMACTLLIAPHTSYVSFESLQSPAVKKTESLALIDAGTHLSQQLHENPLSATESALEKNMVKEYAPHPTPENRERKDFTAVYQEAGEKYGVPWQILYGIHLTESSLCDCSVSNYEGSGAQGPMQFMPETWAAYGVDGTGDGKADINNAVDAIHSAANFIQEHGSVENGLRWYQGNTPGIYAAAYSMGY